MIRVTVWNENLHDSEPEVKAKYPNGLHGRLKEILDTVEELEVCTATLDQENCGLGDDVLNNTDVLVYWAHMGHGKVPDQIAEKIAFRVLQGMGFVALHSTHNSKAFKRLMGTSCSLSWRETDFERIWNILPGHPIAKGIPEYFELPQEEMYGERFDIPQPDETVFLGWFRGGEVFRSGCCWHRGAGKVFYFQPGHETHDSFYNPYVEQIIRNAVLWAKPNGEPKSFSCVHRKEALENIN